MLTGSFIVLSGSNVPWLDSSLGLAVSSFVSGCSGLFLVTILGLFPSFGISSGSVMLLAIVPLSW